MAFYHRSSHASPHTPPKSHTQPSTLDYQEIKNDHTQVTEVVSIFSGHSQLIKEKQQKSKLNSTNFLGHIDYEIASRQKTHTISQTNSLFLSQPQRMSSHLLEEVKHMPFIPLATKRSIQSLTILPPKWTQMLLRAGFETQADVTVLTPLQLSKGEF